MQLVASGESELDITACTDQGLIRFVLRQAKIISRLDAQMTAQPRGYKEDTFSLANLETEGKLVQILLLSSTACIHVLGQFLELLPLSLPAAFLCRREAYICKPLRQRRSWTE